MANLLYRCAGIRRARLKQEEAYNNERSLFIRFCYAGLLGLGRSTAFALLSLRLQLPEVFSASLGDLPPTLPSKTDGGGIFFLRQN
jgi:hypothetical protein